jgi:hypothetical protein
VSSISSVEDETIVSMIGDGQNISEQGKSSEITKQSIATQAEGLVRGLTLIAKDQNPDTRLMSLIFSWSPEKAALTGQAKNANDRPSSGVSSSPAKPASKNITRKTTISPDFD